MSLSSRDRRALYVLAVAAAIALVLWLWPAPGGQLKVVSPQSAIPLAEKRLLRMRQLAAALPAKEQVHKQVLSELQAREKGLIQAETAAQAQAQILQILRRLGRAQAPPLEVRGNEIGPARKVTEHYGEVSVTVSFECRIEQLINLLADLTAQPEALSTGNLVIGLARQKEKTMPVRLTVSGLVPRKLIPEKKGLQF